MSVDSYLELFTSLFGWAFYGILWDVLVGTGIVYLPFLGILIDNWREPAQGGEVGLNTSNCDGSVPTKYLWDGRIHGFCSNRQCSRLVVRRDCPQFRIESRHH